jgi:hypothetical protein
MNVRNSLLRSQTGMTTLGMIILVSFVGLFVFAGIRLTPVYLNFTKVASVMGGVRQEFDSQGATSADIRRSLQRRFEVEGISVIKYKEIKITPADGGFRMSAVYDHTVPFISNISFTVHFDKQELVRR